MKIEIVESQWKPERLHSYSIIDFKLTCRVSLNKLLGIRPLNNLHSNQYFLKGRPCLDES